MLKHRHTDKICCAIVALTLLVTALFLGGPSLGLVSTGHTMGYENRLFDTSRVHTIDIVMDDWDGFLETATNEQYSACSVVVDGEAYKNVGIRAKGNTSLSSVAAYGNNRYSFKVEFDKYNDAGSYYGLDKLSLNNLIQDNTYLKDYLSYTMLAAAGAVSPLCSFVSITVNGEDWGLYLAVEGVEEGFLQRNYGAGYGNLYKPDSMSFGAGRGNGRDFDINQLMQNTDQQDGAAQGGDTATQPFAPPGGFDPAAGETQPSGGGTPPDGQQDSGGPGGMGRPGGGMGSSDVMLQYVDDDPDSYSNIFDNAKTGITTADKTRLIASLKTLSEGGDPASVVDVDAVIKYFVGHTFVRNDDSYTGSIIHNYYLYEQDGVLSMIPWDYNLAFGGFGMGGGRGTQASGTSGATSDVNYPIDSPVSGGDLSSRPMAAWIFENEEYTALYHQYYREFIESYFDSGTFAEEFDRVVALISPYVEKDPTAFCTYEEFQQGVQTLREFCLLRAQSVSGQLDGTIPSTSEGQSADSSALIDASHLSLSDMGSMGGGMGGGPGGNGKMGGADGQSMTRTAFRAAAAAQVNTAAQQPDASAEAAQSDGGGTAEPDSPGTGVGRGGSGAGAVNEAGAAPVDVQNNQKSGSSGAGASPSPSSTAAPDTGTDTQPPDGAPADAGQGGDTNPFQQNGRQGGMPGVPGGGQMPAAESGSSAAVTLIWLGVSVLALVAGIVIAARVKH